MGEEYHEQRVVQQLFRKIFTPLGVIVLDTPARATPGPHPMGGGQLPDSLARRDPPRKREHHLFGRMELSKILSR